MQIAGNVEVSNRLHAATNASGRRQSQRATLNLGCRNSRENIPYLLLQTAQNKNGTQYKVENNIEAVFTKFVNDGKATIRLKEPPHDLIIQADAVQLKSFLLHLRSVVTNEAPGTLVTLNTKTFTAVPNKTKLVVKSRAEYPIIQGFPRTTQHLVCAGLERKSFDRQILRLQSLRILDLTNNLIKKLPKELGDLPNLTELYLASNSLGVGGFYVLWFWMDRPNIRKSLRLLDISNNSCREMPHQIRKLDALVTLKAGGNFLTSLPDSLCRLVNLKYLEVPKNKLTDLPGSMATMRLDYFDVSDNPLDGSVARPGRHDPKMILLPLLYVAARVVVDARLYYDSSTIPFTLVSFLDTADYCICGKSCYGSYMRMLLNFRLASIANSVKGSGRLEVPFDCQFCSVRCFFRYVPGASAYR